MHPALLALALVLAQDPAAPPAAPAPEVAAAQRAEAQRAALETLADSLTSALEEGDYEAFAACFAIQPLLDAATDVPDVRAALRTAFQERRRAGLLPGLYHMLESLIDKGWELGILHVRAERQDQRVLLRMIGSEGGVNYIEFSASTRGRSRPQFVDWKIYALGEKESEVLHRVFLAIALESQRGLLDRLLGNEQLLLKHNKEITRLAECAQAGRWEEGLAIYSALPGELQHEKLLLIMRLALAKASTSDERVLAAIADLRRYFPEDPVNYLFAIDYHVLRKQWKRAADAVRRLRTAVDGDPYLDMLEAHALLQGGELDAARKAIGLAIEQEPMRLQSHWVYLRICRDQRDYDALLAGMKHMDSVFTIEWDDLRQSEGYGEFVASPQHAEWLRHLAAKK